MPRYLVHGEAEILHPATMTVDAEDADEAATIAENLTGVDIDVEGLDMCIQDIQGFIVHDTEEEEEEKEEGQ